MNKVIDILVNNKVAVQTNDVVYVCNNSDFVINFTFDAEWDEFTHKTARFVYNDSFVDVLFTGNECAVPSVISDTFKFFVGVFAGELKTTTPALVSAKKSILCDGGSPAEPTPDVYSQLLTEMNELHVQLGDIETALDGVIAEQNTIVEIQNVLIGGGDE